jgi:hypothetical protein
MLMIVFGAGASYDSAPSLFPGGAKAKEDCPCGDKHPGRATIKGEPHPLDFHRPPLAKDLFDPRYSVELGHPLLGPCHEIVPYLLAGSNLERELQELQDEGEKDPERKKQLAALRYYLRHVLLAHAGAWRQAHGGVTNHRTLLDQVRRAGLNEPTWLVTFNYDRLIEDALLGAGLNLEPTAARQTDLARYVTDTRYRLAKLHGSVDWGWISNDPNPTDVQSAMATLIQKMALPPSQPPDLPVLSDSIAQMAQTSPTESLFMRSVDRYAVFPAIAIPTETKRTFECPDQHLKALKQDLPKVTKMIVIGWRATEDHFLDLLAGDSGGPKLELLIACGNTDESVATLDRLQRRFNLVSDRKDRGATGLGFTDLIRSRMVEEFLAS